MCILTDFFDDEQLFLILEFEFGGSDLENMKGKVGVLETGLPTSFTVRFVNYRSDASCKLFLCVCHLSCPPWPRPRVFYIKSLQLWP